MDLTTDSLVRLAVLAMPVATLAWTVTHEEILREPREWCQRKSQTCRNFAERKFFYLFTCEYCFSHYIAALFVWIADFQLVAEGWRGYLIGWLCVVWVANVYMSAYGRLRLDIRAERAEAEQAERELQAKRSKPAVRKRPEAA